LFASLSLCVVADANKDAVDELEVERDVELDGDVVGDRDADTDADIDPRQTDAIESAMLGVRRKRCDPELPVRMCEQPGRMNVYCCCWLLPPPPSLLLVLPVAAGNDTDPVVAAIGDDEPELKQPSVDTFGTCRLCSVRLWLLLLTPSRCRCRCKQANSGRARG
jgi:hypothetical protein